MNSSQVLGARFQVSSACRPHENARLRARDFERLTFAGIAFVAMFLTMGAAIAQPMTDPTRPPTEHVVVDGGEPAAAGTPVLQSVMITPTLKAAIINGEMVKLGGTFGNAELVKVSESEVVLKSGDATQVLKMYPGVEKRESTKTAPKAASKRTQATQQKPADIGPGVAR